MQSSPVAVKNELNIPEDVLLSENEFNYLINLAKSGSAEAKNEIIRHNLRLVRSVAQRFINRGEIEDLFQIGCLGLIKAVERFDPAYGVKFSTYAVPLVIGEIKQYLRDAGPMKISRVIKENACHLEQIRTDMMVKTGQEPTLSELANNTGLSREEIAVAMEASQPIGSLQQLIFNDDGEGVSQEQLIGEDGEQSQWLESYALKEIIDQLPERLKLIIELRFFQEKTQTEVATMLRVSQVQICRLEKSALSQIRSAYINEY